MVTERHTKHALRDPAIKTRPTKRATSHPPPHSFPTHLLECGHDIRTAHNVPSPPSFPRKRESRTRHCQPARTSWIPAFAGMTPRPKLPARDPVDRYRYLNARELPRNDDVKTTMIYTHVLNRGQASVSSPVDRLRSESFMPVRIRRRDNKRHETHATDSERINADLSGGSATCYTDRSLNFRA